MAALAGCGDDHQEQAGGDPRILDLRLERNPRSVLSCHLTWRTEQPSTSAVEVGQGGAYTHRVRGAAGVTTRHRVLVIGLRADTAYTLRAVSTNSGQGTLRSAAVSHRTGALPAYLPRAKVGRHAPGKAYDGWTLMTVSAGQRKSGVVTMDPDFVPTAVMYDMQGHPVWYHAHGLPRIGDTRYAGGRVLAQSMSGIKTPKPSALEVDLSGATVWTGPAQPVDSVHGHYNHHFERLADGTYLTMKNEVVNKVIGDVLVVLSADHRTLWSWRSLTHLPPDMSLHSGSGRFDYTHGNSLVADLAGGHIYYNSRNLSAVVKIHRGSGKIRWRLGQGGDFAPDPAAAAPWFQQAHGLKVLPDGNLLLYDNGKKERGYSRVVEYRLDEAKKTARIAWQYDGGVAGRWQTLYWGDADRLPNGNTLINAATWAQEKRSRIFEVTRAGEVVWEMDLPVRAQSKMLVGAYNSQRLVPPLLERIGE